MSRRPTDIEGFMLDVVADAFRSATADHWRRRGAELEAARPKDGDFHGQATRAQLRARHDQLTAAAAACRHHADILDEACELEDEQMIRAEAHAVITGRPAA